MLVAMFSVTKERAECRMVMDDERGVGDADDDSGDVCGVVDDSTRLWWRAWWHTTSLARWSTSAVRALTTAGTTGPCCRTRKSLVCVCACVRACVRVCVFVYVCMRVCVYACARMRVRVRARACMHACVCV